MEILDVWSQVLAYRRKVGFWLKLCRFAASILSGGVETCSFGRWPISYSAATFGSLLVPVDMGLSERRNLLVTQAYAIVLRVVGMVADGGCHGDSCNKVEKMSDTHAV